LDIKRRIDWKDIMETPMDYISRRL